VSDTAAGRLILVATPIGNLADLSPRAVQALSDASVIAAEDTRVVRKLLTYAGVSLAGKQLIAVHAHNEAASAERVAGHLRQGATVALTTDAGTPGISDPGQRLVRAVVDAGLPVEAVPGPSAALAALALSGLPSDRFSFEGFVPRKGRERAVRLAAIAADERTSVIFESPRRVALTVEDLVGACGGDREVVLARELTKRNEEVWRGSLAEAAAHLGEQGQRGEFVIVLAGAGPTANAATDADIQQALAARLTKGEDRKAAVAAVAAELGVPKRTVYHLSISIRP
jgi:16S rRNA (cytidine1402-2'-O)-methyltransferase